MSFKVGAEDAEYLEKEYAPTLSQQDIIGIANYTTYCKLNIDNASTRPFDIKTIWDNYYRNDRAAEIIKEYSRKMYARKKQYVDMEIEARLGITGQEIPENAQNYLYRQRLYQQRILKHEQILLKLKHSYAKIFPISENLSLLCRYRGMCLGEC